MERDEFDAQLNGLFLCAEGLIPEKTLPDLPCMELELTVNDWHDFEHEIWEIGEQIRQLMRQERKELNKEQADRVCKICVDIRAKKGPTKLYYVAG